MAETPGWLRKFHRARTAGSPPLIIAPHAGGSAATYHAFSKALREHFDVVLLQYPGRQDRSGDPLPGSIAELADGAFGDWVRTPLANAAPVTVFGHSMGTMVAFELARRIEESGRPVRLLGVSGACAPWQVADMPPHPTDDDDKLLDHVAGLDGTRADLLGHRDLMRMTLPALKADYAAFDSYTCGKDVTLRTPIHAMGGNSDEFVSMGDLYAWQQHTEHPLTVSMFDGGHFYLHDHVAAVSAVLAEGLE